MHEKDEIVSNFNYKGDLISIEKLGNGHINNTYLVITTDDKYVLQQINTNVFPQVEMLMDNIKKVTMHISKKHKKSNLVECKDGKFYSEINGEYYRMYDLIDGVCIEKATTPRDMYLTGLGFGAFQKDMVDFDEELYEVIPNFHNTTLRYETFIKAVEEDKAERACECRELIDEFILFKKYSNILVDKLNKNLLPLRVTHNDTKINNLILDNDKKVPLSVIDLDTVMLGTMLYDFGDAVRSGCNNAKEDEKDTRKIYCREDNFRAICRGFLVNTKDFMTKEEKNNLAVSCVVITYECALRFLTDYLNGDTYFKIDYPTHNLVRGRAQFALMRKMIQNLDQLKKIVQEELGEKSHVLSSSSYSSFVDTKTGVIKNDILFNANENNDKFYFTFKCDRLYNKSKYEEYNQPLYEGDIVELMIVLENDNKYLEIEVNEFNAQYCALIENKDGKGDIDIQYLSESVIISKVNMLDDNWVEYKIIIEKDDLKKLGWNGKMKFNAHRQIFDNKNILHLRSLNPTYSSTFHDIESFIQIG
jgi:N-acetylhexosamine 1-kinase